MMPAKSVNESKIGKENFMKKVLKKSFEQFVKEYENKLSGKKIILTGNLYKDLYNYFLDMLCRGVFYDLPKGYALNRNIIYNRFQASLEIELLESASFYSIMTCSGHFEVYEDGDIREWIVSDYDDIVMQIFVLPMRELIKQMQQYYIDHDLSNEKERSKPCQQTDTFAN